MAKPLRIKNMSTICWVKVLEGAYVAMHPKKAGLSR